MKAVVFEAFNAMPEIREVPDPGCTAGGVVVKVLSTGMCRSDWHGWMGHDSDIRLPHVPGHELAGVVVETGRNVRNWASGDRVTVPFVGGCGGCPQCLSGNHQVCDHQFQPGFTHWGSFAEFVALDYADINLVRLPGNLDYPAAASLGCRFATSFRAVVDQGRVRSGEWVAVHGCGGVGLSAIMIARACGARVVAVDIGNDKLKLARELGAEHTINSLETDDTVAAVRELTAGGVHVSLDALGHPQTCFNSIANLRKRGRHVQVGLMLGDLSCPTVPMARVIADELEILGSHGIQAWRYDAMWQLITTGNLHPERLIGRTISLEQSIPALLTMDSFNTAGITIIDPAMAPGRDDAAEYLRSDAAGRRGAAGHQGSAGQRGSAGPGAAK
jgi:alcohol dehydrogenase